MEGLHGLVLIVGEVAMGGDEAVEGGQRQAEHPAEREQIEIGIARLACLHRGADVETEDADLFTQADKFGVINVLQLGFFELASVETMLEGGA